jgi:NAD-dependent SIR2 family protein deacetylase
MDQIPDFSSECNTETYTVPVNTLQQNSQALAAFLVEHPRLVVLTGAGISAASGIPTYRDRAGTWLHRDPIQEQAFLSEANTRRRYWARSWHGWPLIRDAKPNPAHTALARLEALGYVDLLITQNVDGLHQQAGSRNVIDLHGRVDRVRCLSCGTHHSRESVQTLLARDNIFPAAPDSSARPDGDMEVPENWAPQLALPECHHCRGELMPDVVFFGGSVPTDTVTRCLAALEQADALLAVGSSLVVFSGFRFCRHIHRLGKPVAIINPGNTRADDLAHIKLESDAGPLLAATIERLDAAPLYPPYARDNPS